MARLKLAAVEQHHPPPENREVVLQLEVVENRTLGNNIFQESAQIGDVPLAVAQLVNQAVLGFFEGDLKSLVEGAVTRSHPQSGIENQERLAHGVDDVLSVGFNGLQLRLGTPALGHIFHGQDQ